MTTKSTAMVGLCVLLSALPTARSATATLAAPRNGGIAFLTDGYLKVVDPDGTHSRMLAGARRATILAPCIYPCTISAFAWSPQGTQIAFLRGNAGSGPGCATNCRGPKASLFLINADGSFQRRLSTCSGDCGGEDGLAWSPDGTRIVFSRNGLVTINVANGKLRWLPATGHQPEWSPDGKTIAYSFAAGLFAVDADGASAPRRLASLDGEGPEEPDWSPDGSKIVFGGGSGIYSVRPDGSHLTRLLLSGNAGSSPYHASWSPDGAHLLYAYTPGTPGAFTSEVWTMDASGQAKRLLFASRCCVGQYYAPVWSPDGKKVAFSSDSAGGTFVMNGDGTRRHRLLSSVSALSWSRGTR